MGERTLTGSIYVCIFFLVLNIILNWFAFVTEREVFSYSFHEVLDEFESSITPPKWTYMILTVIYIWIVMSMSYLLLNMYRRRYDDPAVFSLPCGVLFILSMLFHTSWLFIFTQKNMVASAVFKLFEAILLWILVGVFSYRLKKEVDYLKVKDAWLHRFLAQNGLVMYASWTILSAVVNLSMAINDTSGGNVREDGNGMIISYYEGLGEVWSLILLTILLLVWFPMENYVYYETFQYVFTPYFVLVWALTGIYINLKDSQRLRRMEGVYVECLLSFAVFILVARLFFIVFVHFTGHPIKKYLSSTYLLPVSKS